MSLSTKFIDIILSLSTKSLTFSLYLPQKNIRRIPMKLSIKKVRYSIFSHCDFNVEYKSNNLLIVEINKSFRHFGAYTKHSTDL